MMAARRGHREAAGPELPQRACGAAPVRALPRWMRLYLYGLHGVTLDVLLSSLRGLVQDRDPKLMGFSSAHLCVVHALTHLALEKVYAQKFRARPAVFHLAVYPSAYIGLQMLVGNVRAVSGAQLAVHYLLALYFSQVFHRLLAQLRYHPRCAADNIWSGAARPRGTLPGSARFLFFGMHGFLDEVLFTSIFNVLEKSDPGGHTSLWSFLMYGSCSLAVERLYFRLRFGRGWGTLRRLPVNICCVYAWEFTWGLVLRQFGACSWDYSHYPHHFMGLVTLLYLPGWMVLSLYQDVLSDVLLRVHCTRGGPGHEELNGQVHEELNGQVHLEEKAL